MRAEYLKRFFASGNFVKVVLDFLFPVLSSKTIPYVFFCFFCFLFFCFFAAPFNLLIESFKVLCNSFTSTDDSSTSKVKFFNLCKSFLHSAANDVLNIRFGKGTLRSSHGALISILHHVLMGFQSLRHALPHLP